MDEAIAAATQRMSAGTRLTRKPVAMFVAAPETTMGMKRTEASSAERPWRRWKYRVVKYW